MITASEGACAAGLGAAAHEGGGLRSGRARPADRRRAHPGRDRDLGAEEIPPLVSRCRAAALVDEVDVILAPATPLRRAADRAEDLRAEWPGNAGAAEYRYLHAADLVHRAAGCRGAGAASRRPRRSQCSSSPRHGARRRHCASPRHWKRARVVRAPDAFAETWNCPAASPRTGVMVVCRFAAQSGDGKDHRSVTGPMSLRCPSLGSCLLTRWRPGNDAVPRGGDFLKLVTVATAAIGGAAFAWSLIDTMNPAADVIAAGAPMDIDLSEIAAGQQVIVRWRGTAHPDRPSPRRPR